MYNILCYIMIFFKTQKVKRTVKQKNIQVPIRKQLTVHTKIEFDKKRRK